MGYKEMRKQFEKKKQTKKLDTKYMKFSKPGDSVLGALISTNVVQPEDGTGEYRQYIFDTDDGGVKCAFGAAFDKSTFPLLHKGGFYLVEYKGKESIGKGRSVNRFEVTEFTTELKHEEPTPKVK